MNLHDFGKSLNILKVGIIFVEVRDSEILGFPKIESSMVSTASTNFITRNEKRSHVR